jgi:hypothetical protein
MVSQQLIDHWYTILYARHATADEEIQWSALSRTEDIRTEIGNTGEAAQYIDPVLRLYIAAFGRAPDVADPNGDFDTGPQSGYWTNVNALRNGMSLGELAEAFVGSAEWKQLHGSSALTEANIIGLYHFFLQRSVSSAEISAWMHSGADMAHVLIGISESTEARDFAAWKITDALKFSTTLQPHPDSGPFELGPLPPGTFAPSARPGGAFDASVATVGIADHPDALVI